MFLSLPTQIAHISDIHFGKISLNPLQFFSKRWVGNANLILNRKNSFKPHSLSFLAQSFLKKGIKGIIITGDCTTTSLDAEYEMSKALIKELESVGFWVITLPGNHDHYTKKAYKQKRFYDFISSTSNLPKHKEWSLRKDGIEVFHFNGYWIVALDTTLATPLFSASGNFNEEIEKKLEEFLKERNENEIVILCNHFPFFKSANPRNRLIRDSALEELLRRFPCVKLYLHGHNHRNCITDLRCDNLPIILDSGSISKARMGSWNLISLKKEGCHITPHFRSKTASDWEAGNTLDCSW